MRQARSSAAVTTVPITASEIAVPITGRISPHPAESPPSNRISTSPIVPSVLVNSASSNSTPPGPSDPTSIPSATNRSSPGTRTRSATFAAMMPTASRAPATKISSASDIPALAYPASSAAASRASISCGESGRTASSTRGWGAR